MIAAGAVYEYAKEVLGDSVTYLKLGMVHPLPDALIRELAEKTEEIYVIEELDPVIENHCKAMGISVHGKDVFPLCDEFSQAVIARCMAKSLPPSLSVEEPIPVRPPVMCCGCPHRGVFYVLKKNKVYVSGDIGLLYPGCFRTFGGHGYLHLHGSFRFGPARL